MHRNPERNPKSVHDTRNPVGYQLKWSETRGTGTSYVHQRCLTEFLKELEKVGTEPPTVSPIHEWTYDMYCLYCDL
jgi:hypothetical protein